MEKVQFIMETDTEGRITVKGIMQYIKSNLPEIAMPDKELWEICLLDLSMNGKSCHDGYFEYIDGKQYKMTLIFR